MHGYRLVWGRSSFLGGQRHAAQWGGDPASTYGGTGSTLRGGLSYAFSGAPFWSHDVGGFVRSGTLLPVDPGPAISAAADPESLAVEVWAAEHSSVRVQEQRGTTEVTLARSGEAAEVTTSGPGRLGRLEWPMVPGPAWPGRVIVNGQPWRLDRRDADRLTAIPGR